MKLNSEQQSIIDRYSKLGKTGNESILEKIPENERRYKCHTCHTIVDKKPCPVCNEKLLKIMCPLDHCHCGHDIIGTIDYCPLCGQSVCPEDLCHDVLALTRITGYIQALEGFNSGKAQEVKDRVRYKVIE